jgi:peptide-methionine (S)-S-oxide reductase
MLTPRFDRYCRHFFTISLIAVSLSGCIGQPSLLGIDHPTTSPATIISTKLIDPPSDLPLTKTTGSQTLILAGGCFWGVEAVFEQLKGVSSVVSGFSGGAATTAHYDLVSNGSTGHAEAVKITYDPTQISLGKLLQVYFFVAHDPTQINQQEPDHGTQYRSAIFFANPQQQQVAKAYIDRINQAHVFSQPIATQVVALTKFYPAEDYHQDFIDRHPNYPYVVTNDLPKLDRLRQQFPTLIKKAKS